MLKRLKKLLWVVDVDRFVKSGRERFVVASLDIVFLDELFRMFAERDVCHHFFMKGDLLVCFQRNNINFHHVFFVWGCFLRGC